MLVLAAVTHDCLQVDVITRAYCLQNLLATSVSRKAAKKKKKKAAKEADDAANAETNATGAAPES